MVKLNSLNYNPIVLSESFVITLVLLSSLLQNCLLSVCYKTSLLNHNKEDSNRQYEFSLQDEGAVQNLNNLMQHILTNKIIQQGKTIIMAICMRYVAVSKVMISATMIQMRYSDRRHATYLHNADGKTSFRQITWITKQEVMG